MIIFLISKTTPFNQLFSKLKNQSIGVHLAGERCDPDTIHWLQKGLPNHVLINDSWWQTESGSHISGNNINL